MNRRQALVALSAGIAVTGLGRYAGAAQAAESGEILDAVAPEIVPPVDDVRLPASERRLVRQILKRLQRLQTVVGHANYNLLDYPQAVKVAAGYTQVGKFTRAEQQFIERLFYTDALEFGFVGPRLVHDLGYRIEPQQREKVLYSGHYLFKSQALEMYQRLHRDIGSGLLLTSGIRGVVKQTHLFLARVDYSRGNISDAARSLAPPAYSFHSIGDFDVGQRDFGYANFTRRFVESDVYRSLTELEYVRNRYSAGNALGMRFEPWHVEVA